MEGARRADRARWRGSRALSDYAHLERLAEHIRDLPDGELGRTVLLAPDFLLYRQAELAIYFAPFDFVNESALVALVGITPGFTQDASRVRIDP